MEIWNERFKTFIGTSVDAVVPSISEFMHDQKINARSGWMIVTTIPDDDWLDEEFGEDDVDDPVSGVRSLHLTVYDNIQNISEAGVERAVIVPPSWEGDRNDCALEAVARYPGKFAIMGRLPIEDPRSRERVARDLAVVGMQATVKIPHVALNARRDAEHRFGVFVMYVLPFVEHALQLSGGALVLLGDDAGEALQWLTRISAATRSTAS